MSDNATLLAVAGLTTSIVVNNFFFFFFFLREKSLVIAHGFNENGKWMYDLVTRQLVCQFLNTGNFITQTIANMSFVPSQNCIGPLDSVLSYMATD